ncbi:tripartite tricarboxylate transporter permease [Candidatus Woesearchaeota archaeon]|nr:tripartite tricarboxylate transporter permease [Candidatus Woesearchaeota archaeon]
MRCVSLLAELLLALLLGVGGGIITGLTPGIHINLVSLLLLSISPLLLQYISPLTIAVCIVSMAITHTFLDAIPSIFLGAPDADQALNVLPGHKLLMQGKGYEAVKLTVIGALGALLLAVAGIPLLIPLVKYVYPVLQPFIGYILVAVVAFMILKDKHRAGNFLVFTMSGILGILVLNMPNLRQPLFPLLSGLFGVSMLVTSYLEDVRIPKQRAGAALQVENSIIGKSVTAAAITGSCTAFFPGLGPAQGAVIASQFLRNIGDYGFMILVGGINTVNMIVSLVTLYAIDKARNGAVLVIAELMEVDARSIMILAAVVLIAGGIATALTLSLTKKFSQLISRVNYRMLVIGVALFIAALVLLFSGLIGLLILLAATAIGIVPAELGVARNHAMGCLLLPVILFFLL